MLVTYELSFWGYIIVNKLYQIHWWKFGKKVWKRFQSLLMKNGWKSFRLYPKFLIRINLVRINSNLKFWIHWHWCLADLHQARLQAFFWFSLESIGLTQKQISNWNRIERNRMKWNPIQKFYWGLMTRSYRLKRLFPILLQAYFFML